MENAATPTVNPVTQLTYSAHLSRVERDKDLASIEISFGFDVLCFQEMETKKFFEMATLLFKLPDGMPLDHCIPGKKVQVTLTF